MLNLVLSKMKSLVMSTICFAHFPLKTHPIGHVRESSPHPRNKNFEQGGTRTQYTKNQKLPKGGSDRFLKKKKILEN